MDRAEIEDLARDYLIENVGNMVGPGEVYYDAHGRIWVAPIIYQNLIREIRIGDLKINPDTGEICAPTRSELLVNLEKEEKRGATMIVHIEKFDKDSVEAIKQLRGLKEMQLV